MTASDVSAAKTNAGRRSLTVTAGPYLIAIISLALGIAALWPGATAGSVDWTKGRWWPDAWRLNAQVHLTMLLVVSGALGSSWREVRRRIARARDSSSIDEPSPYDALSAVVRIALGGAIAGTAWLVIQTLLLNASGDAASLIGVNVFGAVALALVVGFYAPELMKPPHKELTETVERSARSVFRSSTPTPPPNRDSAGGKVVRNSTEIPEGAEVITLRARWEQHPDDLQLARQLADVLRSKGQTEEAARVFDAIIDADPEDDLPIREKAKLYLEIGDQRRYVETVAAAEEIAAKNSFKANIGKTITLAEVEIRDLPFFGNFTWALQPNVNVLLGKNGFGKSHLLRAIVAMLQNDRSVTGQFFAPRPVRGAQPTLRVDINKEGARESTVRSRLVFDKQFGTVPVLAIPDMRYIEKSDDSFAPVPSVVDLRSQGATHFMQERSFQGLILNFLYELCREFDKNERFDRPIFRLMQEVVQALTDRTFKFHDIVELDSAGFRILVVTDGNESNPLPLQKASQGTLSVLSMVGLIYKFLKSLHAGTADEEVPLQQAIVVIDEIDAHLHPTWQQQILQLFRDKFPNVQFIVTAHTPLVVAGCKRREVAVLQKDTGGFTVDVKDEHFIGASAVSLYRRVFEVEDKDLTYLRLNTLQGRTPEWRKRVEELEDRPTRTPSETAELEDLEEKLYYLEEAEHINAEREKVATYERDRQRIEMDLKNQQGKVSELQGKVSELQRELDAARGPRDEADSPAT